MVGTVIELNVTPMGAVRQTQADRWKKRPCVLRYRKATDDLRSAAKKANYKLTRELPDIDFILPMPKSWSKKKKLEMDGKPHQQKSDADNILKFFIDALQKDVDFDDCEVWQIGKIRKFWGQLGKIRIYE